MSALVTNNHKNLAGFTQQRPVCLSGELCCRHSWLGRLSGGLLPTHGLGDRVPFHRKLHHLKLRVPFHVDKTESMEDQKGCLVARPDGVAHPSCPHSVGSRRRVSPSRYEGAGKCSVASALEGRRPCLGHTPPGAPLNE